jgi:hypothetical protein
LEFCRDLVFGFDRVQGGAFLFLDIVAVVYQILDPIATAPSGGREVHRDGKSGVYFLVGYGFTAAGSEQHHNQEGKD